MSTGSNSSLAYTRFWGFSAFAFAILLYLIIFIYGPSFIVPTQVNDALAVSELADDVDTMIDGTGGYYYTALVASRLSNQAIYSFVFINAVIFLFFIFKDLKTPLTAGVALFLSVSPILLFLPFFMKDTFTPVLTILTILVLSSRISHAQKILLFLLLYIPYGAFFRQYYLIIAVIFVMLVILKYFRLEWKIVSTLIFLAILVLVPDSVFADLQGARDWINEHRVWSNIAGNRTAFINPYYPDSLWHFILNYVYAIYRLNFSFLYYPGARELFLTVNVAIFGFLSWIGLRTRSEAVWFPALLFGAHFLVMMIFEPDLGTYLRHISSVLLYVIPSLSLLDRPRVLRRAASTMDGVAGEPATRRFSHHGDGELS